MPPPEKTPAPARRFLPPPSTGVKPSLQASNQRPSFQTSYPTQPGLVSPFGATPRFHRSVRRERDDIQTNLDDEVDTPVLPKVRVANRSVDTIEVEDDEPERSSPLQYRDRLFTPVTKRRKTSHLSTERAGTITISSSPESNEADDTVPYDDSDLSASGSDLNDMDNVALNTPDTKESYKMARFRATTSGLVDSTPLARTVFKFIAEDAQHASAGSGPLLPDIFSPSRRKGKRDYVAGSSADLVRSWILNISAEEKQAASIPDMTIVVQNVMKDSSGRFVVVVDEDGSQWLLPAQHQKESAGRKTTWAELGLGTRILLKGQSTRWSLRLESASKDLSVAAYWELLSRGEPLR